MKPNQRRTVAAQTERTYCDCRRCKAFCRTMPGDLAPGDLERIANYLGIELTDEFVHKNFLAAQGRTLPEDGTDKIVPTIVPAQKTDGSCVFLTSDERCAIHTVAPFGCSKFNYCDEPTPDDFRRMKRMLNEAQHDDEYLSQWARLFVKKHKAPPLGDQMTSFKSLAGPPITKDDTNDY